MSKVPFSISLLSRFGLVTVLRFPLEVLCKTDTRPLGVLWEEKTSDLLVREEFALRNAHLVTCSRMVAHPDITPVLG
jgi:hypothetical protein